MCPPLRFGESERAADDLPTVGRNCTSMRNPRGRCNACVEGRPHECTWYGPGPKPSTAVLLLPYRILVQVGTSDLETEVNSLIEQGYAPLGPPVHHKADVWVQAILLQPKPTFPFPGKTS